MNKLFTFLIFTLGLCAQENSISFSLEEAITFALSNNKSALDSQNNVRLAELQKWETTSTGLPQINADISYNSWIQQQIILVPAIYLGGEPGDFSELAFGNEKTINSTLTITQKIFDGSYLVALQASKVYLSISKNALEKTNNELRKAVTNAYGNVLLTEENIKILDSNIRVIEKNIFELEKVYQNGMTELESIEQLQLTLSGLLSARNYNLILKELAYEMFNLTIGLKFNSNVNLTDSMKDLIERIIIKSPTIKKNTFENTTDFKIALNNLKSKELLLKLEKSKALPSLDAFINGTYIGNGNSFNFLDKSQKWFGASLFGINMSIPIFSSLGRSASTKKAKINVEKSQRDLLTTRQEIEIKIKRAENEFNFAQQNLQIKNQALSLARKIEQKNQVKFSEGISSSFELSQAQTQLYNAQKEYIEAMLDVLNKHISLDILLNPNTENK